MCLGSTENIVISGELGDRSSRPSFGLTSCIRETLSSMSYETCLQRFAKPDLMMKVKVEACRDTHLSREWRWIETNEKDLDQRRSLIDSD